MSRGLLTEAERRVLERGPDHPEVSRKYYDQVRYRVRKRIREHFSEDMDVLKEHYPAMFELVDACMDEVAAPRA